MTTIQIQNTTDADVQRAARRVGIRVNANGFGSYDVFGTPEQVSALLFYV